MKKSFKCVIDERLNHMCWDDKTDLAMEHIHARLDKKKAAPKKRVRGATVLAFVLILALVTATAFALVELVFSRDYSVGRTAKEAVMQKYGLTQDTIEMFFCYTKQTDDGWLVTFAPKNTPKAGMYTVTIKGRQTEVSWTNDGADRALWENGDLSADIWGHKQLAEYMEKRSAMSVSDQNRFDLAVNMDTRPLERRAAEDDALEKALPDGAILPNKNVLLGADDLSMEELNAVVENKLQSVFSMTVQQLEDMGYRRYVSLTQNTTRPMAEYCVTWVTEQGEKVIVSCGANGENALCNASTFPGGKLPDGPLDNFRLAVNSYIKLGMLDTLSSEERADVESRIWEAGLGDLLQDDGTTEDLQEQERITEAAWAAVMAKYGLPDEALALFGTSAKRATENGAALWTVAYWPSPQYPIDGAALGEYTVTLSADAKAIQTTWSLDGVDDGSYSQTTWGQAKVYDASILPWVIQCANAYDAIMAKYGEGGEMACQYTSVEDAAAVDQLMRDAGFSAERFNHVPVGEGDLSQAEAWDIFAQALQTEFDVSRDKMEASVVAYAELAQETDCRTWYFWIQNSEEQMGWTAVINAQTGEVLMLSADPFASGNG